MTVVWLTVFTAQLIVCLYLGYRVAAKTGRSRVNWLFVGFLAAIPPIVGVVMMIVCVLWYPPRITPAPLRGANPEEHRATRGGPNAGEEAGGSRRPGERS